MPAYMDPDTQRFGFMERGRTAYCILNHAHTIRKNDSRLWDNERKHGPLCEACAQARLSGVTGVSPSATSETLNAPASPSVLSPDLDKRLEHAAEQIERLQAEIEAFATASENILTRIRRLETFHKNQDHKQGYIWQAHVTKFQNTSKES
jgi:hypothetical protein